jgi:hypothetical protein
MKDRLSRMARKHSILVRRGAHHVRHGLVRSGVPQIAGRAARMGGHGWRRISTVAAAANSGGRFSRPASALWGRITPFSADSDGADGDHRHRHRNRRLAWDFAVITAAAAILLMLHHQFRRSPRPVVAAALVASADVPPEQTSQEPRPEKPRRHRRRSAHAEQPVATADARASDPPVGNSAAVLDREPLAPKHTDVPRDSEVAGDLGDRRDGGKHADRSVPLPVDAEAKSPQHESGHVASKADADLDSLLSTPSGSSAPHDNAPQAPIAQSEPEPTHVDKPVHPPTSDDPLLVDSKTPGDSPDVSHHEHHHHPKSADAHPSDDFKAPDVAPPHASTTIDAGPKDEFAAPITAPATADPPPANDDAHHHHHHKDHPADHGPADQTPSPDLATPPLDKDSPAPIAKDSPAPKLDAPALDAAPAKTGSGPTDGGKASDPLLDVAPKLDGPTKTAADAPPKTDADKPDAKRPEHTPEPALPVLSVPSPHKSDADSAPKADLAPKADDKKSDDLPAPARTANAGDSALGGSVVDKEPPTKPADKAPEKPPADKPSAANDAALDELLKTPSTPTPSAATPHTSAPSTADPSSRPPEQKPSIPPSVADSKADPFHSEPAQPDRVPKHVEPLPAESSPPKANPEPPHAAVDEDSLGSVSIAHHVPDKSDSNGSVHYKIVVRNNGKKPVKVFDVEEAIPAEHTVQVTDPAAETHDQALHWTLRDVAPGEERTIMVTLAAPPRPPERHPASEPSPVEMQPIAAAAPHVESKSELPRLRLELITPIEVHAGESCRIGFRATNLGGAATDLNVNLDLPQQLRYKRGQQLVYKIGALGDHEAREDYLTATATGTGQVELRGEILHAGQSIATAKGTCRVAPAGGSTGTVQQTGAWAPHAGGAHPADDCLCWP